MSAALANLATTTAVDRETAVGFTKTIWALAVQVGDRDAWSKSQNDEIKRLVRSNCIVSWPATAPTARDTRSEGMKHYKTKN
jgi:hypothetical protein